jgi:hypothetical protein
MVARCSAFRSSMGALTRDSRVGAPRLGGSTAFALLSDSLQLPGVGLRSALITIVSWLTDASASVRCNNRSRRSKARRTTFAAFASDPRWLPLGFGRASGFRDLRRRHLGGAEAADLAGSDQVGEGTLGLVQIGVRIGHAEFVDVDVVGLQASQ